MEQSRKNGMNRKILILDIETKPTKAYIWRAWDENTSPEKVIEPGGLLCWSAKWVGKPERIFYSEWGDGRHQMLNELHKLLNEADAVVTYNGDKFDLPIINGEFLLAGFKAPAPLTSIDVIKHVKKFGFLMNRLAYVGPLLDVGRKLKHEGFGLWVGVMNGDIKAQARMRRYNIQDVVLLERLYKKILPFIKNHPHLGDNKHECGACGSNHIQSRGFSRTKYFKTQRLQCQSCGSWSQGTRKKI